MRRYAPICWGFWHWRQSVPHTPVPGSRSVGRAHQEIRLASLRAGAGVPPAHKRRSRPRPCRRLLRHDRRPGERRCPGLWLPVRRELLAVPRLGLAPLRTVVPIAWFGVIGHRARRLEVRHGTRVIRRELLGLTSDDDIKIRTLLRAGVARGSTTPAGSSANVTVVNPETQVHIRVRTLVSRSAKSDYGAFALG
jgi:hypothetical protein